MATGESVAPQRCYSANIIADHTDEPPISNRRCTKQLKTVKNELSNDTVGPILIAHTKTKAFGQNPKSFVGVAIDNYRIFIASLYALLNNAAALIASSNGAALRACRCLCKVAPL